MNRGLLVLLAACGGGSDSPSIDAQARACSVGTSAECMEAANHSDLAWIEANVFAKSCAFSGCHNGANTLAGRLDLKTPGASHTALVGRDSAIAQGTKLVVPGQPKQSYLLVMLQAFPPSQLEPTPVAAPPDDIGFMPQNAPPICCQKVDAVERWIAGGALAN